LPGIALLMLGSSAFVHLMALPAFEDEGSQLRLIWRIADAGEWLQPLMDGKPLEAWPMIVFLHLGIAPLEAIRALHVLAGIAGALLTYRLGLELADRSCAFVAAALFALNPFAVYLQRLALADVLLSTAGVWVLLATIRCIQAPGALRSVALAASLLLAALCKMPVGFVFFLALPLALAFMPRSVRGGSARRPLKWILAAQVPAWLLAVAVAGTAVLRAQRGLLPGFGLQDLLGIGAGRYQDIAAVMGIARPNLASELAAQLSWPVVALGFVGVCAALMAPDWRVRWLAAVGLVPLLLIGLAAHFWYPRYLLFTLPPLMVAAVYAWHGLLQRFARFGPPIEVALIAVCAGLMGREAALLIADPVDAHWSPVDRFQYIEGWGSGYGYEEAADYLLRAVNVPQTVYALDGHSAYQLRTYLPAAWSARVGTIFYGRDGALLTTAQARFEELESAAPVWIIVSPQILPQYLNSSFGPENAARIRLQQVSVFDKPGSRAQLALYAAGR
jgi:4-amino-4-deoxy-L-arabinose transferase-like glycosyltransferase